MIKRRHTEGRGAHVARAKLFAAALVLALCSAPAVRAEPPYRHACAAISGFQQYINERFNQYKNEAASQPDPQISYAVQQIAVDMEGHMLGLQQILCMAPPGYPGTPQAAAAACAAAQPWAPPFTQNPTDQKLLQMICNVTR